MASTVILDLRHVARGLDIPLPQIQAVVELLDDGNTVPFIARYRKDQTNGLDEVQIRHIQARLTKMRLLAERKQTILRSIEAQGKLDEMLAKLIQAANTTKRLEDLYLPFKPKKQTLAAQARVRGLEPLAREIAAADPLAADLDRRAADFVSTDRQVPTAAEALLGAGHILAEQFSERADLRQRLREILQRTGKLSTVQVAPEAKATTASGEDAIPEQGTVPIFVPAKMGLSPFIAAEQDQPTGTPPPNDDIPQSPAATTADVVETAIPEPAIALLPEATAELAVSASDGDGSDLIAPAVASIDSSVEALDATVEFALPVALDPGAETDAIPPAPSLPQLDDSVPLPVTEQGASEAEATAVAPADVSAVALDGEAPALATVADTAAPQRPAPSRDDRKLRREQVKKQKAELKKKKEEQRNKAYSDFYQYEEEIKRIPPHRILAINRGERARVIRVKLEGDLEAMYQAIEELLVPEGHPHADFLRGCGRDALLRLIVPSLEREVRRELTERAETHAVDVFARNLRKLLLQPPIRDRRLLAVDPGFKSGCKLAALDQFGNVLEHATIFLVGRAERRQAAAAKVVDLVTRLDLQVIVIGNGTACRATEDFMAQLITKELAGRGVAYVIVNEAGASVYSASPAGREEFPQFDVSVRGAISIGRRLEDPLSELVKIDAANIGVGLYQHDVKAKHLSVSLDEVVESCVNFVGVEVNTASPALLRYVSGMNQLTARRVYEHRRQHGPFRNRAQLKEVPGVGEATFVQAAGFLKIVDGDNPLDATWIHPESYPATERILEKLACTAAALADKAAVAQLAEKAAQLNLEELSQELGVGQLTLRDILAQLVRPGRDPREDLPRPVFKQGVLKLEDLSAGMELSATVLNVVDFGAFVDIGVHHTGLIHVSQLADKFIRDPHEVISVGDVVKVWVLEVDKERRRVSLTMIPPGTVRTHTRRPQGEPQRPESADGQPAQPPPPKRPQHRPPQRPQSRPPARSSAPAANRPPPPKPKPKKPLVPITDEMKAGKAPLRSFGDLLQFYEAKQEPEPKEEGERRKDE